MKLTKLAKEAFVRAVMRDVPKVNNRDKIQKILSDAVRKSAFRDVNELYDKHPIMFRTGSTSFGPDKSKLDSHRYEVVMYICIPLPAHQNLTDNHYALEELEKKGIITEAQSQELVNLLTEERKSLIVTCDLEQKLEYIVQSCNTLKQLREALPEFEKYMPSEKEPPNKNLPALANVVADFVAAGWPKDKKEEEK